MKKENGPGRAASTDARGKRTKERRLTLSLRDFDGGYEVIAECEAERTSSLVFNGGDILPRPDLERLNDDPFARSMLFEHLARCNACRAWAGGRRKS